MPPVVLLPRVADFVLIGTGILLCVSIYNMAQCFLFFVFFLNKSCSVIQWNHSKVEPPKTLSYLCMDEKLVSPYCPYLSS